MLELNRIIAKLSNTQQISKVTLSYVQFEQAVKHIAVTTFHASVPLSDKLRMLLIHIRNPCKAHYKTSLTFNSASNSRQTSPISSEISSPNDRTEGETSPSKLPPDSAKWLSLGFRQDRLKENSGNVKVHIDLNQAYKAFKSRVKSHKDSISPLRESPFSRKARSKRGSPSLKVGLPTPKEFLRKINANRSPSLTPSKDKNEYITRSNKITPSSSFHNTLNKESLKENKRGDSPALASIDLKELQQKLMSNKTSDQSSETDERVSSDRFEEEDSKNFESALDRERKHYRNLSGGCYLLQSSPRKNYYISVKDKFKNPAHTHLALRRSYSHSKADTKSLSPPKPRLGIEEIFDTFERFKESHIKLTEEISCKSIQNPPLTRLRKHQDFIFKSRASLFSSTFVKQLIFNAWKGLVSKQMCN
jgi:hypothetical protein